MSYRFKLAMMIHDTVSYNCYIENVATLHIILTKIIGTRDRIGDSLITWTYQKYYQVMLALRSKRVYYANTPPFLITFLTFSLIDVTKKSLTQG